MRIIRMGIQKQIGQLLASQMARETVHTVREQDALRFDAAQLHLAAEARIHGGIAATHPQHTARHRRQQPYPQIEILDRAQRAIGRELRRMYDGVVSEAVPDEFLDLLRQIDDADGAGDKSAEKKS